ncbi:hypothetical protein HMPREF9123_2776 [Neisseria bacilliformis ATCC BAA-1200]|uniref:Uncharacterized protein n=1 Tax=Neisseria bacilliformis ATCC BAA-1200 TaxID=888742 RepID=F2BGB9_9NEIS|nr:hypothetical protein HMPREF9123_2776 [Neisseria bacilliformis ATCC BAA-1200]
MLACPFAAVCKSRGRLKNGRRAKRDNKKGCHHTGLCKVLRVPIANRSRQTTVDREQANRLSENAASAQPKPSGAAAQRARKATAFSRYSRGRAEYGFMEELLDGRQHFG